MNDTSNNIWSAPYADIIVKLPLVSSRKKISLLCHLFIYTSGILRTSVQKIIRLLYRSYVVLLYPKSVSGSISFFIH